MNSALLRRHEGPMNNTLEIEVVNCQDCEALDIIMVIPGDKYGLVPST